MEKKRIKNGGGEEEEEEKVVVLRRVESALNGQHSSHATAVQHVPGRVEVHERIRVIVLKNSLRQRE